MGLIMEGKIRMATGEIPTERPEEILISITIASAFLVRSNVGLLSIQGAVTKPNQQERSFVAVS